MNADHSSDILSGDEKEFLKGLETGGIKLFEDIVDPQKETDSRFRNLELSDYLLARDLIELSEKDNTDPGLRKKAAEILLRLGNAVKGGSSCLTGKDEYDTLKKFPSLAGQAEIHGEYEAVKNGYVGPRKNNPIILFEYKDVNYVCYNRHFYDALTIAASAAGPEGPRAGVKISQKQREKIRQFAEEDHNGSRYNDRQKAAVAGFADNGLYIITGGPGTGKTTVVSGILYCFLEYLGGKPEEVALCAPTGRAAARMKESIEAEFKTLAAGDNGIGGEVGSLQPRTLHSIVNIVSGRNCFDKKYRLVIVDEFSMADLSVSAALFEAVDKLNRRLGDNGPCRLILLGDPGQLPSVEAGTVLKNLTEKYPEKTVELNKNYRSQKNIITLKDELEKKTPGLLEKFSEDKNGDADSPVKLKDMDDLFDRWDGYIKNAGGSGKEDPGRAWFLEKENPDHSFAREIAEKWYKTAFETPFYENKSYIELVKSAAEKLTSFDSLESCGALLDPLFDALNRFRLLCCVREGAAGCETLNELLQNKFKKEAFKNKGLCGTPLMITRNDRTLGLYNGDVGVVISRGRGNERAERAVFKTGEGYKAFPLHRLPEYETAFAVTVHKSQGSEYGHVLLLLPDASGSDRVESLLTNEILYTAVTRAKKALCIAGNAETLKKAAERRVDRDGLPLGFE